MAYGFNSNTYTVLKDIWFRDTFSKQTFKASKGTLIGSAIVNQIIVDDIDRAAVKGLEGQPYIDKMVELKYVKV